MFLYITGNCGTGFLIVGVCKIIEKDDIAQQPDDCNQSHGRSKNQRIRVGFKPCHQTADADTDNQKSGYHRN